MTFTRLSLVVMVLAGLQALVFAYRYEDLLFLRQSVDLVATAPTEEFMTHAVSALQRSRLTRDHLETLAAASHRRGELALEIRALRRLTLDYPDEPRVRLRLADSLRRAGRLDEAESVYLAFLGESK